MNWRTARAPPTCGGALTERYADEPFVRVLPLGAECAQEAGFLGATACNDTNRIELMVFAGAEHVLLSARYDNLGKGAAARCGAEHEPDARCRGNRRLDGIDAKKRP